MSLLKKLFGGGGGGDAAPTQKSVTYKDFTITPAPIREGTTWRIAATIEKDGRTHRLIRADTLQDLDAATEATTAKARQVIDEQGERIFS